MLSNKEQKVIKSLKVKKYRLREKRFLVEGTKNVLELLDSDFKVDLILGTEAFLNENNFAATNIRSERVKEDLLSQLGTFKTNEQVLAVAQMKEADSFVYDGKSHLFVLDGISDPGNLGTIIRTLDWFGFRNLVCSSNCAEFYHPRVISSTMGSFTRTKVYYEDLPGFLQGISTPKLGADMGGDSLFQRKSLPPHVIVMGSESHGISDEVKSVLDGYISIPKSGEAESLNVGVATGIIAGYLRMLK